MAEVKEQGYKGFAYIKGNDKPYVTYGNSSQEIINRLQGFNRARSLQMQYATVNIGQLDMDQNKYMNYQKYDVVTGKNITPIYLKLPPLSKDEFKMLTIQLKEEGARYNGFKKAWYVTPDLKDKFAKYISDPLSMPMNNDKEILNVKEILAENGNQNSLANQLIEWQPKHNMIGFKDTITVHLENDQKVSIDSSKLPKEYWTGNAFDKLKILDDVLDDVMAENIAEKDIISEQLQHGQVKVVDKADYVLSVSKNIEDNECTVYFKDGSDPIHLYGDQFGVSFPKIHETELAELVENYLLNQSENLSAQERLDVEKGNGIKGFLFKEIDGETVFQPFQNTAVEDNNGIQVLLHYKDMPEDSAYEIVKINQLFSAQQKEAAEPVLKIGRSPEEIKMICNAEYSPAQMEEMVSGIRDGLSEQQIKVYADPQIPSWKMDMYRIGLQHGIPADRIATLCEQSSDWIGARTAMTDVIKEHRLELAEQITKAGFKAAPETVRKLEQLNHLTGRENTMKDICRAFKERTYTDQPKIDELVKDIGRDFQMQEVAAMQQPIR